MSTLIEEIKSGNKNAVKAIYQEYAKDVYNFAKSITGDHDSALAATKKTFGKLINNIKKGDEPKEIRTALLKIAYDEACAIAMPSLNNAPAPEMNTEAAPEPVAEEPVPERIRPVKAETPVVTTESEAPAHEEIYMPKGGYDSLQVEEPIREEVEEAAEMPRRRRPEGEAAPRRRRPEGEAGPRRRKPFVENPEGEMEERPRKRRPIVEEAPIEEVETFEEEVETPEEEYEAPKPKKKAKPVREEKPVEVYEAFDEEAEEEEEEDDRPRNKGLFIFCIILNIVLILILLWFLGGLLVNLGVLPQMDLGYSWFNNTIYPLF